MRFSRNDSATYLAAQLAKSFSKALNKRAAALGFSPGQFPVLLELWNEDGLTQRQLLDRVDVEQATLANTLARMERDGLIERKPHPRDRRAQIIELTDKGRDLERQAIAASRDTDNAMLAGLLKFERHLLLEYMGRTIDAARAVDQKV
ncbi:MarR family winged helix-turn-helix transcriptional regulator [Agrobacterium rubi]|uniref:MarR family transcriptional regulator n=1 Tax=Agrobacterium rubi TaxID=28099 RepID=A0AAE7R4W9_9HYPH|nr:MarR family transcriptional regulator [Agrobacterium rubi]NTE84981.1 MarR family transcriptional regulator [Agrobacterium rubi]NTF00913.1 MarR family transcriptional regulator [Agrobacterium rubi]NTF35101.1 MarR family transcriptional regulator [Agrobacterium rubi]OCJ48860.1 MarR family transcriptional regulator [Agrobacterium rubi]QTG00313.1 MarR family transcriptional regulator [Agrobacterium rubi]